MTTAARPAEPSDRVRLDGWLRAAGVAWPAGRGFVAFTAAGDVAALARLVEPPPGDGHHREHVRTLLGQGEPDALRDCASLAARHWDGRLEARTPSTAASFERALAEAGLEREVTLAQGWAEGGTLVGLHLWGRGGAGASAPEQAEQAERPKEARRGAGANELRFAWHDASTRPALDRFLRSLVPGRSYPPGTLLSEAERLETTRRGLLDAAWVLALAADAEVVGGLVLDREPEPERAHVRRVHLDVAPGWRGMGVATGMLRFAREGARARLGALVLESDPRAGNRGACDALASAGFERAGVQRGAWRLRRGARRWDEDVLVFRADTAGEASREAPVLGRR